MKCISSVLHRQLGVEDGLPPQTSKRVAKLVKVKMQIMLKFKNDVLYRFSICRGCVDALSLPLFLSSSLNEGPGIQQMGESTEAAEQPSHDLQDPENLEFTFTAATIKEDVKRMPKEIRGLVAAGQIVQNGISSDGIDAIVGISTMARDCKDCPYSATFK
ncbi:hypothetical protein CAPTEDRAFT_217169 [Capitella teleta]|uniref:Uncharacterized protein n=1 Tax=Capitella teleta TaxID=283909 RepID=R7TSV4_CAPTE|nr:hypothetical protein CAPTEDRAFT_217169 [Capitella teleta]|eukprot:ELT96973.1 hypothetical protein CAPTEDRAFT_217169 [Capitella teleta]